MSSSISDILRQMSPITLDEMKDVRLMNRVDTKYVLTEEQLREILLRLNDEYYVQEVENKRISSYSTVYYDTPDLRMFVIHQNRHRVRDKVRVRTYVDSNLTFCEVKHKNNKGRTSKRRIKVQMIPDITKESEAAKFLAENQPYDVNLLKPMLLTAFDRITLVNYGKTERLTIDCNLCFHNFASNTDASLGNLAVMELKQDGRVFSPIKAVLFDMRIRPFKMSKYCIGTTMTRNDVKSNRFKKKIRKLEKLKQQ